MQIFLITMIAMLLVAVWYMYYGQFWTDYRKAKKEIVSFVKSYKRRCRGNNRFLVTVESLQDSFREYDAKVIEKVWLELIRLRLIEQDPQDNEWCVR